MSRWWPGSLFGRVAAIVLAGFAAAYAMSFWSVMRERAGVVDTMMAAYVGRDVASSIAMLERLPPTERSSWLERLARPNYRFTLDAVAAGSTGWPPAAQGLASELTAQLGPDRLVGVRPEGEHGLLIGLRLSDGAPASLHLRLPRGGVSAETAWLLFFQLLAVGACTWWAVRLATRPLSTLAQAATRLGDDPDAPALPEAQGPTEVRRASAAFNAMQARIAAHMAERLQILAAVSHDLQTPLTRMRVRTDMLADGALRDKLQADLLAMQHLVEEGLAYARSAHAATEKAQAVDLYALLDGLVCDYTDAGQAVALKAPEGLVLTTRPQALRRIVANLLDNALKFGEGAAQVEVARVPEGISIWVGDRGPGMPEDQLTRVMQPFYRIEGSRSRETGGSGLGLAIAQRLSVALGAQLQLRNREGGGLQAVLVLPLPAGMRTG